METNTVDSIKVKNRYAEIIASFDTDLQSAVDLAMQRYVIDQLTARIAGLRKKDSAFQAKYGCDYDDFHRRISEDEQYVNEVEKNIDQLWEADLADWEFCFKGIGDWTKQLQNILIKS